MSRHNQGVQRSNCIMGNFGSAVEEFSENSLDSGFERDCPIQWEMYESVSKEKALIKCLLERYKNYTTVGRPVRNTSELITVEFGLSLIQIMNVDEKNQVLETNVWYTYQWKDALLTWDPTKFDGLQKIMVPPESVWIPDIVLYNFADSRLQEQRKALVNIFQDGSVMWIPQAILRSTCAFDTRYFPYDETTCHLKFGSWTHDGTQLDLKFFQGQEKFLDDDYIPGNEWDLVENYGIRNVEYYECCDDTPFLDLKFYVKLKRRTAFYSFTLILPCALLSCLTLTIFWVPPESPAKLMLAGNNIGIYYNFVMHNGIEPSDIECRIHSADSRLQEQRKALVNVYDDGTILWMPQAILRSTCAFDTKYFPFDATECHLKFGSWTHDGNQMDIQFFQNTSKFMTEDFIPGNEWRLIGNHGERYEKYYECCPGVPFLDLKFFVVLERRTAFYSFILLLPCALLSMLTLVIFWVPPESPAKLQLGMNIFVAFFVLLLLLSESTPKAAESIPLIGGYFCLSMVMITMSTVLATIIANMFFRGVRINRAPYWLRSLMIDGFARLLCLRGQLLEPDYNNDKEKNQKNNWGAKVKGGQQNSYSDTEMKYARVRLLDNGRDSRNQNSGMPSCGEGFEQNNIHNNLQDMCVYSSLHEDIRAIRELLEKFRDKKAKAEMKEKCLREWKVICCVTDRLFFISYLLINVVGIIVIFYGQVV